MKGKIRRIISILLMVCFIASVTAASVSACSCYSDLHSYTFSSNQELKNIAHCSYPYSLHYGSSGEAVRLVQRVLISSGYYLGPSGADGYYGYYTKKAVISFQSSNGLSQDGIVGPCTLRVLDNVAWYLENYT